MPKSDQRMFQSQHHNAIAKDIRGEFELARTGFESYKPSDPEAKIFHAKASAICDLAITFAKRFVDDNTDFDPISWLDQCSPNTDLYPLSELWED